MSHGRQSRKRFGRSAVAAVFTSTKQTVRLGNQQSLPLLSRASNGGAAIRLSIAARAKERAKPLGSSHRVPYIGANLLLAQSAVWPQLHTYSIIFASARHRRTVSSLFGGSDLFATEQPST
jgi:hypothetical protein